MKNYSDVILIENIINIPIIGSLNMINILGIRKYLSQPLHTAFQIALFAQ